MPCQSSCRFRATAVLLGMFLAAPGCGSGRDPNLPATLAVTGKVSLPSGPLEIGTITFHPEGDGNPADGRLLSGGAFELSTYKSGDGAVPGKHKVTIQIPPRLEGDTSSPTVTLPPQYASVAQTTLTAEVTPGGKNHFEFVIDEKAPAGTKR